MNYVQKGLLGFSRFQQKNLLLMIIIIIVVTSFFAVGITKVKIESDFAKLNPRDLPITSLDREVSKIFGRTEGIVIIVEIDEEIDSTNIPLDIRDPEVIEFLVRLEKNLKEESIISEAFSIGTPFQQGIPPTLEGVKQVLNQIPQTQNAISKDYSFTIVFIEANIGSDNEKIKSANKRVDEIIKLSSPPSGIKTTVTGDPALGSKLFDLLISDALRVLILATIFIFILLLIVERSLRRALITIVPLLFGLSWILGLLGWLDIPITVGTAGLSAMLLGLGVEYAIFLNARYKEERKKRSTEESLEVAVSNVGTSILSSGGTTAIGFYALGLSIFPVLSDLGISLGSGILMLLAATIGIGPVIVLMDDKLHNFFTGKKTNLLEKGLNQKEERKQTVFEKAFLGYGRFVSKNALLMFILAIIITVIMFVGIQQIKQEDFDFETVLPEDLEELQAFFKMQDEFGGTSSVRIYVFLESTTPGSDEPIDIREEEVLRYVDMLTQKARYMDYVEEVSSISKVIKEQYGRIPDKTLINPLIFESGFINNDYSGTVIRITVNEQGQENSEEVVRQINEIIQGTLRPVGVEAKAIGGLAVTVEQNNVVGPDSSRTSLLALIVIIVFLYILTRSIKRTFLPLTTVFLGVLWTLGVIGWGRIPFNSITNSVITITIGVGIDFGLQLMNRYDYELKYHDKKKAMEITLGNMLFPMILTVIAALVGFRAMNLGDLKLMADLGTTISIAITVSMLASITGVASLMVLLQRKKKKQNNGMSENIQENAKKLKSR
jgi:predicted RND superfamily exporter protein